MSLLDLTKKENLHPDYLRMNAKGVVPTLVEDDAIITESSIIIEYLDDAHPDPPLRPRGAADRARMRAWIKAVDDVVHPANGAVTWPILVLPLLLEQNDGNPAMVRALIARVPDPSRRDRQSRFLDYGLDAPDTKAALSSITKVLDQMDDCLATSKWLAGAHYSLADAALTPYVQTFAQFGLWEIVCGKRSHVAAWFDRIRTRASFVQAIERSVPEAMWTRVHNSGQRVASKIAELMAA